MPTTTEVIALSKNFIGGAWVESKSTQILERRNPANNDEVVARIALSTRQEMKEAIVAAKAAYPAWRETPAPARGKILFTAARIMQDAQESLLHCEATARRRRPHHAVELPYRDPDLEDGARARLRQYRRVEAR